jgi:hypothetical protein
VATKSRVGRLVDGEHGEDYCGGVCLLGGSVSRWLMGMRGHEDVKAKKMEKLAGRMGVAKRTGYCM